MKKYIILLLLMFNLVPCFKDGTIRWLEIEASAQDHARESYFICFVDGIRYIYRMKIAILLLLKQREFVNVRFVESHIFVQMVMNVLRDKVMKVARKMKKIKNIREHPINLIRLRLAYLRFLNLIL